MIRRELPLTNCASPAKPVAYFRRGFSFVLAPAAADPVLELERYSWVDRFCFFPIWKGFGFVFSCSHGLSTTCFGLDREGPDKAQQLSCDCSHDLPLILACHAQLHVALMQAILRLPCDLDDCWRNTFVSLAQLFPDARQVSIAPGRFHHDASEVRVTGLGDAAFSNALAAGIFARKYSALAHQLPCALEAGGDVAQLRCDRDCRDMRYTAQSLQTPNYVLHGLRCQLYHFENGFLQPLHPCAHVLDFVHTIQTRDFLRRLRIADLRQPPHVTLCPRLQPEGWTLTRAEKELG